MEDDRTPSPSGGSATSRGNPFSIDYILSSSAAAAAAKQHHHHHRHHQSDQNALDQLNIMNQQRAQLMAAAAAAAQSSELNNSHQQQTAMPQIKIGQQQQQQQQTHPNFLYFMACMLLQHQQQQQQQQHLQHQNHQRQQQQQQQQVAQQQAAAAAATVAANNQQQLAGRQPIDLARSPMDSLAILARLTGAAPASIQAVVESNNNNGPGLVGKHQGGRLVNHQHQHHHQTIRHQPYQLPTTISADNSRGSSSYTSQSIMSALSHQNHQQHDQMGATITNRPLPPPQLPNLDLLTAQQRRSGVQHLVNMNMNNSNSNSNSNKSSQHQSIGVGKFAALNTISCSSSSTSHHGNNNNTIISTVDKLDNMKPAHSYIGLIGMCILSSPEKRMVLNDIYQFILDNYPYYRNRGSGWRNSVRHNLSLNECFQKAGRAANGKGHYWTIHPANMEDFMLGDFRRRRAQRKVRRWNNMDVPSDESEDESMEDATKPPLPEHFKRSLEMHRRLEMSYQKSAANVTTAAFVAASAAAAAAAAASSVPQLAQPTTLALNPPTSGPCSPTVALFRKQELQ